MTEPPRPSSSTPAPRAAHEKRAALPRELADFLIEFSIALHKHAMYPGGHPTLVPAADGVARRLDGLLAERGTLSLGVARDQLIIEGIATDPRNPVLHDLAERLHRHHLGAVSFTRGVSGVELEEALKVLALEADRQGDPIGLRPAAQIPRWPHVQLFPLTFDRLELVGGPDDADGGGSAVSGGRAAQLWVGLARAALASEDVNKPEPPPPEPHAFRPEPAAAKPLSDEEIDAAISEVHVGEIEHAAAEPTVVAKAIEGHERGTAYDQVIVGYLLQIAEELKTKGGAESVALKKKMSRLITALDETTLSRLVDMGGDQKQRRQFILDATQGMAADAVVDLLKASSGAGSPISNSMLRMLSKLSQHAERGPAARRTIADTALREQVAELVQGWELSDPNPDGYALALQRIAAAAPTLVAAEEAAYSPEAERIVQMAIETGGTGQPLERAMESYIAGGRAADLIGLVERARQQNPATERIRQRVLDPSMLKLALGAQPADFALADRIAGALGPAAAEPMLDVLMESESRQVRRVLIDKLLRMPEAVRPLLPPRVADERWYVVRNALFLAAELPGTPLVADAMPHRSHADARVRREALRVLFRSAEERTRAICTALADDDPRIKRLAVNAILETECPAPAVPLLVTLATDTDQDTELRVPAIRALAAKGNPLALQALLKLTEIRRRSLMDVLTSSQATPEYLAALSSLAPFRADARVRERLELAGRSKDPAVARTAAEALKGGA